MKIGEFLDRQHVIPGLNASDKPSLLRALAERAAIIVKVDENAIQGNRVKEVRDKGAKW